MPGNPLNILAAVGSLHRDSVTRVAIHDLAARLRSDGARVDLLDLDQETLPLYHPDTAEEQPYFAALKRRVELADVFILGTPDYHGSISGTLKNFLDHFWREFAGKLFVPVVASHEKGLTVMDHLRTVARQCYAWSLPYGVSFAETVDVRDGLVASDGLKQRLEMLARDVRIYGGLLARQRRADLAGNDPGFLARRRE